MSPKACSLSRRQSLVQLMAALACTASAQDLPVLNWPKLPLLDGSHLEPDDLRAVPTVLVFFSTDCGYCRRHNQRLQQLANALPPRRLRVLGAALDRDPDLVQAYQRSQGLQFPLTWDAQTLRQTVTSRQVVPFTAVVGLGGLLRERIPGEMAEADIMTLARWALP